MPKDGSVAVRPYPAMSDRTPSSNGLPKGDYTQYDLDGAVVIDKRAVLEDRPGLCIASPLFNAELKPNEIRKLDRSAFLLTVFAESDQFGEFGSLSRLAIGDKDFNGLDYVGIAVYTTIWRNWGAFIGVLRGGQVQWEEVNNA